MLACIVEEKEKSTCSSEDISKKLMAKWLNIDSIAFEMVLYTSKQVQRDQDAPFNFMWSYYWTNTKSTRKFINHRLHSYWSAQVGDQFYCIFFSALNWFSLRLLIFLFYSLALPCLPTKQCQATKSNYWHSSIKVYFHTAMMCSHHMWYQRNNFYR